MTNIIHINYSDSQIDFNDDGWFNATVAAAKYGKRPIDWLRLPETVRYLDALCRKSDVRKSHFTRAQKGNSKKFTQGTWLHPKLAVRFAQWLDMDFAIWCDEQIDSLLRDAGDLKRLRHKSTVSFKVMNDVLLLNRKAQGKDSTSNHFINEAKLVNWALTGEFKSIDRSKLSIAELDLLAQIEVHNAVLIGSGMSYEFRKVELKRFADESGKAIIGKNATYEIINNSIRIGTEISHG